MHSSAWPDLFVAVYKSDGSRNPLVRDVCYKDAFLDESDGVYVRNDGKNCKRRQTGG